MSAPIIVVPADFAASYATFFAEEGRAWIAAVPALAASSMERWSLRPDGPLRHGKASLVLPVRRADGRRAALKLQRFDEETVGEPVALHAWAGRGAVNLLEHHGDAMLLERLDGDRPLTGLERDADALQPLAEILARLVATPAPPTLRRLEDIAIQMLIDAPCAAQALRESDRRLVQHCAAAVTELVREPGDQLLHWDLHYDNVLAGAREPWLAIDPKPLAGDPGFDLLPALRNRWEQVVASGDIGRAVRWRFDLMVEVLGLDRPRAVGWTLGRLLQTALWDVEDGEPALDEVAVAIFAALT